MNFLQNPTNRLLFQYLMPLVYAVIFYVLIVLPNEASIGSTIFLLSGFYLGNILLWADGAFLYPYYNELRTEPKQLITRSATFILAYILLALFVITSSGSYIGMGIVLGIGLTLFAELYSCKDNPELFHQQFLSQLKRTLSQEEITKLVHAFGVTLLLLTLIFYF